MRRQIVLLAILAAAILAILLLRPRPRVEGRAAKPVENVVMTQEPPTEIEDREPPPAPPRAARSDPPPPAPVYSPDPARECLITVLNASSKAVPDAVVLILKHPYGQPSTQSKVEERRSNEAGLVPFSLRPNESADALAYKAGVGTGSCALSSSQTEGKIKLQSASDLEVRCLGAGDVPLEGAEIELTTEALYQGRVDAYGSPTVIAIALPPRKALTAFDGSARFEAPFQPTTSRRGWRGAPGIRHQLSAEWNRLTTKVTIDKKPDGPVLLYPQ